MRNGVLALLAAVALGACGGGGGGLSPAGWTSGQFLPAANFVAQCAAPRTGRDPFTGALYPDRPGSLLSENNWLRSWSNDLYLWYSEIADQNPANFMTALSYFGVLKTTATTTSGAAKDKFHFTYPTAQWEALSQGGSAAGYGPQWEIVAGAPPRQVRVAYLEPNAPASATETTLGRGALVLQVDGVDVVNGADVAALNAGFFPAATGESHSFVVQGPGVLGQRTITLVSANIISTPVMPANSGSSPLVITTPTGKIGYLQFNDHIATAEAPLVAAFTALKNASINDLVLDIRYNGGGYLDIASEVAYMIAGATATAGRTFELTQFNSKHPSIDPVAGGAIAPLPFHASSLGFSVTAGQALPTLNLGRVFVLTGTGTCSASEAIINGLTGVGVMVYQFGSTTCGKPYGFYPQDNCGTTYFSIEFRGVNAANFGDYTDGFTPQNALNSISSGARLPGCSVADDFTHALGDPLEGRFAAALAWRDTGICPTGPTGIEPQQLAALRIGEGRGAELVLPEVRRIRIMR
jgi:hypothetical protein